MSHVYLNLYCKDVTTEEKGATSTRDSSTNFTLCQQKSCALTSPIILCQFKMKSSVCQSVISLPNKYFVNLMKSELPLEKYIHSWFIFNWRDSLEQSFKDSCLIVLYSILAQTWNQSILDYFYSWLLFIYVQKRLVLSIILNINSWNIRP